MPDQPDDPVHYDMKIPPETPPSKQKESSEPKQAEDASEKTVPAEGGSAADDSQQSRDEHQNK